MRHRLASLVLLLLLGFGLFAGHVPCHAGKTSIPAAETAAETVKAGAACHATAVPEAPVLRGGSPADGHDCCSGDRGVCQHACHTVAEVRPGSPALEALISVRVAAAPVCSSLPLLAQPIDHIPLA